jgi:hypothetical protein
MMDGFVSSWEHHEPSACIAGLPADEPSLFISLASLSGQQRRWTTAEASVECLIQLQCSYLGCDRSVSACSIVLENWKKGAFGFQLSSRPVLEGNITFIIVVVSYIYYYYYNNNNNIAFCPSKLG